MDADSADKYMDNQFAGCYKNRKMELKRKSVTKKVSTEKAGLPPMCPEHNEGAEPGGLELPLIGAVDDGLLGLKGSVFRRKTIEGG